MFRSNRAMDAALTKARSKAKRSDVRKTAPLQSAHGGVKQKKDPGIPNLTVLKAALSRRADREQAKEDRRNRHTRNAASITAPSSSSAVAAFSSSSSPASEQRDDGESFFTAEEPRDAAVAASRHHFYRDLRQVIADSDIVLEVLDARDPLGCRNLQVEAAVVSALQSDQSQAKRLVLVLNKIDLVSAANLQRWLRYLKRSHPVVAFKASTQQQAAQLNRHEPSVQSLASAAFSSSSSSVSELARSGCVGASALIQLLKNYSRNLHMKRSITVGVIGAPNVGKSSLINSLKRCRAVAVGNKPGVTRHAQHVRLDKLLTLIDSPGVIAAEAADSQQAADGAEERLLLRNCISVDKLSDPVAAAEVLLQHVPLASLLSTYSLPASATASSFLVHLARKQGKLLPGGLPNVDAAARCLLQDLNSGKISYETEPPEEADAVAAGAASAVKVVQGWAEEFDVEALLAGKGELRVERPDEQDEGNRGEQIESSEAEEAVMTDDAAAAMQQG